MSNNIAVTIFYSNYSGNCKALFQCIKNFNLMDKLSIKFINIDNEAMKDIISKKFSVVPSIVVMIEDEISLYTGDNAFEWFNMFTSSTTQQHTEPPDIFQEQNIEGSIESKNTNSSQQKTSSILSDIAQGSQQPEKKQPKTVMEMAAELSKARESIK